MGLMTHVVVGYPTLDATVSLINIMDRENVDFIELQIPFSDPLADGPTIMKACERSLQNGTKVKDAFVVASKISGSISSVLIFMAYYNTVFKYGVQKFCRDAKRAGVAGLIVPDVPIEEENNEHFLAMCKKYDLISIRVISPASTDVRLAKNAKVAQGFVYCTARQGITGAKKDLDPKIVAYLKKVRQYLSIPIAVGFGISSATHVQSLKKHADIAVVGSALIDVINGSNKANMEKRVGEFIRFLRV